MQYVAPRGIISLLDTVSSDVFHAHAFQHPQRFAHAVRPPFFAYVRRRLSVGHRNV